MRCFNWIRRFWSRENEGQELHAPSSGDGASQGVRLAKAQKLTAKPQQPVSGDLIKGRYRRLRILGMGSMGKVYLGYDVKLQREVAIKEIPASDATYIKQVEREARLQAQVHHPAVCEVYDVVEEDGYAFIIMEYIDGEPLSDCFQQFSVEERVRLLVPIAFGVHEAHRKGLVHRDIKPANIIVRRECPEGKAPAVLTDFGLARKTAPESTITSTLAGTPVCMAPEQIRIESLTPRTDVYALGVTLYYVVTGHYPFEKGSPYDIMQDILTRDPPFPRTYHKTIHSDLETIILRCLEKRPEDRYDSARSLAEDLQRYLDGDPILARPISRFQKTVRWFRRHPEMTFGGMAILLFLMMLGGMALYQFWYRKQTVMYLNTFLTQLAEIETLKVRAYMSELHDLTPAFQEIQHRISVLEQKINEGGRPAQGPGFYVLGRIYAALDAYERAREYFARARETGMELSDVRDWWKLMEVLTRFQHWLRIYRESDSFFSRALILKARKDGYFRVSDDSAEPIQNSALRSQYDIYRGLMNGQYRRVLNRIKSLETSHSTVSPFEIKTLEGFVYLTRGVDHRFTGSFDEALKDLNRAVDVFRKVLHQARSYPLAYLGLTEALLQGMEIKILQGLPARAEWEAFNASIKARQTLQPNDVDAVLMASYGFWRWAEHRRDIEGEQCQKCPEYYRKAIEYADRALREQPENPHAFVARARAYMSLAAYIFYERLGNPVKELQQVLSDAHASLKLSSDMLYAYQIQGYTYRLMLEIEAKHNPYHYKPSVKQAYTHAVRSFEKLIREIGNFAPSYKDLAYINLFYGHYLCRLGRNGTPYLQKAVDSARRALELAPGYYDAQDNLVHAYQMLYQCDILVHRRWESPSLERAIQEADVLVTMNPDRVYSHRLRLSILSQAMIMRLVLGQPLRNLQERMKQALQDFQTYISADRRPTKYIFGGLFVCLFADGFRLWLEGAPVNKILERWKKLLGPFYFVIFKQEDGMFSLSIYDMKNYGYKIFHILNNRKPDEMFFYFKGALDYPVFLAVADYCRRYVLHNPHLSVIERCLSFVEHYSSINPRFIPLRIEWIALKSMFIALRQTSEMDDLSALQDRLRQLSEGDPVLHRWVQSEIEPSLEKIINQAGRYQARLSPVF